MVNFLSLVSHQGRLFITAPSPEQDGLLSLIDLKDKNKVYTPVDIKFNVTGGAFLVADTRGQVTMFQIQQNKYMVVTHTSKTHSITCAHFTGRKPTDHVFVGFKDYSLQTHSLNGKVMDKFTGAHTSEIRAMESNGVTHLATLSNEACILWSNASNSVNRLRSIFSKDGNHFTMARFSADGQSLVTLFKDGDILQWGLDA
jgi:WD40 repeat protein